MSRRPVPARARLADPAAHREAVRRHLVAAGRPDARDRAGGQGDPRLVAGRHPRCDFRGEHTRHTLMPPTFVPGPNPYGAPPVLLGALGPGDDPDRGRGRRRPAGDAVPQPPALPRAHPARPSTRGWRARAAPRRLRDLPAGDPGDGPHRRGAGGGDRRRARAARVLRLDAGVPPGARGRGLGRPAARAQRAVQAGRLRGDVRAGHRRDGRRRSPCAAPPRSAPPRSARRFGDIADRVCCYFPGYDAAAGADRGAGRRAGRL